MMSANDIMLLEKANRYKLNPVTLKRIWRLVDASSEQNKIVVAMNYAYSLTRCKIKGMR